MKESLETASEGANQALSGKIAVHTTGTAAAVGSSVPPDTLGNTLAVKGFWILSYAEYMQIIASLYVITLLFKTLFIPVLNFFYKMVINYEKDKKKIEINVKDGAKP